MPNAVPVSIETPQFSKNVISSKISGRMRSTAQQMMNGSVPHARQNAVRMPISGKTSSTLADVFTPEQIIFPSSFHEKPCFLPVQREDHKPRQERVEDIRPQYDAHEQRKAE